MMLSAWGWEAFCRLTVTINTEPESEIVSLSRTIPSLNLPDNPHEESVNYYKRMARLRLRTNLLKPFRWMSRCVRSQRDNRTIKNPFNTSDSSISGTMSRDTCVHYDRRCQLFFPCCETFYPCHMCHNADGMCDYHCIGSDTCTKVKCNTCSSEMTIDEKSKVCNKCNSKMADYFCSVCKLYASDANMPFHCKECGVCRKFENDAFHCKSCGVCLEKRHGKDHACRPGFAHEECAICCDDTFSGAVVLVCSHKFHERCVFRLVEHGQNTCPICREAFDPKSLLKN